MSPEYRFFDNSSFRKAVLFPKSKLQEACIFINPKIRKAGFSTIPSIGQFDFLQSIFSKAYIFKNPSSESVSLVWSSKTNRRSEMGKHPCKRSVCEKKYALEIYVTIRGGEKSHFIPMQRNLVAPSTSMKLTFVFHFFIAICYVIDCNVGENVWLYNMYKNRFRH